ncbi:MAG: lysophospholipid acyltransferase family protein [Terrisporobacter sp.]
MYNYIKFALFQIFGFIISLPKLLKLKFNEAKYSNKEKFEFVKKHAKKSLDVVKIKVNVIGREKVPKEDVLFVLNHSSMLDSYILVSSVEKPVGVVIADVPTWQSIPIVSTWLKLIKCVYINRDNNREGIKSINKASENIKEGQSMAVFPEGDLTWVKEPNALISEFKPGSLKIAYKAKCPIVPMVIKNSRKTYEGYEPVGRIFSEKVEVEYLDAIYDHLENPKLKTVELAEKIKNKMIESMHNENIIAN